MSVTSTAESGATRTSGRDIPVALACFVESTARFAACAVERGDLVKAKLLPGRALHAVDVARGRPPTYWSEAASTGRGGGGFSSFASVEAN
jgi:hypothetical protein